MYDHKFRVSPTTEYEKTKYCIKILDPDDGRFHLIYIEPRVQFASSKLLIEKELSTVEYIKSNSYFSYFKTRIHGKNFYEVNFYGREDYKKRYAWIQFSKAVINSNLLLRDLTRDNLMYDEINERWEIIDGSVRKLSEKETSNNQEKLMDLFFCQIDQFVVKKLIVKVELKFKKEIREKVRKKPHNQDNQKKIFSENKIKSIVQTQTLLLFTILSVTSISLQILNIFNSD